MSEERTWNPAPDEPPAAAEPDAAAAAQEATAADAPDATAPPPADSVAAVPAAAGPVDAEQRTARRRRPGLAAVALVALGAVLGAAFGTAATYGLVAARQQSPAAATAAGAPAPLINVAYNGEVDVASVYAAAAPGVVQILTRTGAGSGFVVDGRGYIVTNFHVVSDADTVRVKLDDGTTVEGKVLGRDPSVDLAVVQIDPDGRNLTVLPLGDSDQLRPGEPAIAIGFPLNQGKSVTSGVISGLDRSDSTAPNQRTILGMIQTDAAINPGSSGGPLLDGAGRVIGVNTQIESQVRGFTGIGLAVPVNTVKRSLDDLIAGREIQHPWLGISAGALDADMAKEWGLTVDYGVVISDVYPNSPAAQAGLRPMARTYSGNDVPGDVIIAVDGRKVTQTQQITAYLDTRKVGDVVQITVVRDGQQMDVAVTLQAWPEQFQRQSQAVPPDQIPGIPDWVWPDRP